MNTSMFTRFNRKNIDDRQIDTLIGLSKGIIADGKINQLEAEFLQNWLIQNSQASSNPIILNLLEKVDVMLNEGILDNEEVAELHSVLKNLSGDSSEFGELAKTTTLPINEPMPPIIFEEQILSFHGDLRIWVQKAMPGRNRSFGWANS